MVCTFGSGDLGGVGGAFYVENSGEVCGFQLPDICSVFATGAVTIYGALEWCAESGVRVAVVVSGSRSVLESVEGVTARHFDGFVMCGMGDLLDQLEVEIMFV